MDVTDLSFFGGKLKSDKADANKTSSSITNNYQNITNSNKVIVSRATRETEYDCNHPCVGIALIFNHKDVKGQKQRVGTERDRDAIYASLTNYGFDVRVFNDLTFADLNEKLKETAQEDHQQNDCLLVVVMSHGYEGKIFARDMAYPVERLWNAFLGENCTSLINKPKLFFIQACRGANLDKAVTYRKFTPMSRQSFSLEPWREKAEAALYAIPNTADMLVMYSTFDKHYSFRNIENGSWFIQSVCDVLDEAAMDEASSPQGAELLHLLTAINRKVAYEYQSNAKQEALNQMKEMPNFMSTLTKTFYLRVKRKVPEMIR
uniref:Caspase family p20 domain-containing protein n=1 Tax=Glossina palpalis gambiensis TaxID=67801 RepID=A0A1B0AN95_9MUSC